MATQRHGRHRQTSDGYQISVFECLNIQPLYQNDQFQFGVLIKSEKLLLKKIKFSLPFSF